MLVEVKLYGEQLVAIPDHANQSDNLYGIDCRPSSTSRQNLGIP
jgi:hypothetical protein